MLRVKKERKKTMKKLILTVVAVMTMTVSYARPRIHRHVESVQNYELTFDMRRLAAKLDLTADQMEAVSVIHNNYNDKVASAATVRGFERAATLHSAVRKDISDMHRVLNEKQFQTYMMLLGTTLKNQHLQ